MPTTRMIDPLIWKSESMAKLTLRQRLLFIGLFSNADDQGRCRAHPALVRSNVFPYDEISADEIAADLKAIEDIESIKLYTDKTIPVLQILNWWKYQHPQWAYPSNIAPLDGWHDRLRYRKGERQVVTVNWDGELPNQLPNQLPGDLPGAIELGLEVALEVEVEKPIGADAPADTNPRDQLRFDKTPEGALMAQKLRAVYESKGRRSPEFYANASQREAYLIAFGALGGKIASLLETAMERDITDRSRLLAWLQGCAKRDGNGRSGDTTCPPDKLAQAERMTRERLKASGIN